MEDGVDTPQRLPRPHRLGHRRDAQRDHLGHAAQAHGLDQRGLPRRRRRPRRPARRPLHHQQLRPTRRWSPLQNARRLPAPVATTSTTPARSSRSAPRRTPPTGSAAPGSAEHLDDHLRQRPTCGTDPQRHALPDARSASNVPAYFSTACGSRWLVQRDTIYDTGQFPAQLYPATDDRYVVGRRPGTPGRRRLGHRRRAQDHGRGGGRLERHLRQPSRRRQGRAHVGRRQRPRGARRRATTR